MREYVLSLRAIWRCWQDGGELAFEGEHYRFTRMQPFFNPGPIAHSAIPIYLGAVGPNLTQLVGEVADGIITHPTNSSPRQLREATLPELAAGAAHAGRGASAWSLMAAGFVATGPTAGDIAREREKIRELLAFLFSTRAYWRSLDLHGWRDVGEKLRELSRRGCWSEMAGAVGDEMLDTLVPKGPYGEIAATLESWYGGLADGITFPLPDDPGDDAKAAAVIAQLRDGRVEHPRPENP
jgi:probable F420-dependent oxidoreductase